MFDCDSRRDIVSKEATLSESGGLFNLEDTVKLMFMLTMILYIYVVAATSNQA